jgi:transposase InsO family protein
MTTSPVSAWISLSTAESPGDYVTDLLDCIAQFRELPCAIRTVHGPEFTSRAMNRPAYGNGIDLKLIAPGNPTPNAYIETFNAKFRDEGRKADHLNSMAHARVLIGRRRRDYNENPPYSSLGRDRRPNLPRATTGNRLVLQLRTLRTKPW